MYAPSTRNPVQGVIIYSVSVHHIAMHFFYFYRYQSEDNELNSAENYVSDYLDSDRYTDVINDCMYMSCSLAQSKNIYRHSLKGRRLKPVSRYSP